MLQFFEYPFHFGLADSFFDISCVTNKINHLAGESLNFSIFSFNKSMKKLTMENLGRIKNPIYYKNL